MSAIPIARPFAFVLLAIGCCAQAAPADPAFDNLHIDQFSKMLNEGSRAYEHHDYDRAFPVLKRTACAGDKASQAMVGTLYVQGKGVAADSVTGYAWLRTAAEYPNEEYTNLAHRLEQAIAPDQRPAANEKAQAFIKLYGMNATHMSCVKHAGLGSHTADTLMCNPAEGTGITVMLRRCADDASR